MSDNIKKVAQVHNERDDTWYDTYKADAIGTGRVIVDVPREVREPGNVRKHLLRKGADISDLDHSRGNLILAIQSNASVVRRAGSLGWRKDENCFVAPNYVIGSGDGAVLPPPATRWTRNMEERGTLAEWQDLIDCARFSTTMILILCASFAAPLMRLLNIPNFGLVVVGPSRCAKSTCQLVGASVYGFGTEENLPTPKGTSAGLIETASQFNDLAFPLNELGAADGDQSEKYYSVLEMTYTLTSGQDTIRHSSWGGVTGTDFKTLVIMSSEVSPDEWAARAGVARDAGETARLIGSPALHAGQPTVFDSYPVKGIAERRPWTERQFSSLRAHLPNQRGVPLRVYLEAFVAERDKFIANAREDAADFRERLGKYAHSRIAQDIVAKFAGIYAGGRAAFDAGVLRFDADTIYKAVSRSCRAALRSLPDPAAELREDLMTLQALLEGVGVIDADEASTRQKRNMNFVNGYFQKSDLGRTYTVRATEIMKAFPTHLRARRVLEWLDDEGKLRHQRERKVGVSTEWAQTQITWPGGQRVRSFVLYFPDGLKVLQAV